MKPLLFAALVLIARCAGAGAVTPELLLNRSYPDELGAVIEAGARHLAASKREDREFFGAILRDTNGRHWLSVARGNPGRDQFEMAFRTPRGMYVRAFWHTHGRAGDRREFFSASDAELVRSTARPLYLITPHGKVRVLRPDATSRSRATTYRTTRFRPIELAGEQVARLGAGVRRT